MFRELICIFFFVIVIGVLELFIFCYKNIKNQYKVQVFFILKYLGVEKNMEDSLYFKEIIGGWVYFIFGNSYSNCWGDICKEELSVKCNN